MDVIKIGGSIILDDEGKINKRKLKTIFQILSKQKNKKIIVIGCGKKQHEFTFKWNLTDKPKKEKGKIKGIERRYEKYLENSRKIDNVLEQVKKISSKYMKVTVINPDKLLIKKSKGTSKHEIDWMNKQLLDNVKNPLISGGIIPDKEVMFSAISSDTIAAYIAKEYKANKLILLSDVDGVYNENRKLVKIIKVSGGKKLKAIKGGMKDKIRRIKPALQAKIKTYIANGTKRKNLEEVIINKRYNNCTTIKN